MPVNIKMVGTGPIKKYIVSVHTPLKKPTTTRFKIRKVTVHA